jgi:hypothetical protein
MKTILLKGWRCRHAILVMAILLATACTGMGPVINPILEERQAALAAEEAKWRAIPNPTSGDWIRLGIARYQVWEIHHARATYRNRHYAAMNRRQAARLLPQVQTALDHAYHEAANPREGATAAWWLANLYRLVPDHDRHIAMLQRILREHAAVNAPELFGVCGTPQYFCHLSLATVYRKGSQREKAVDAYARAALALADCAVNQNHHAQAILTVTLGELLDYEPRAALPEYEEWLVAGTAPLLHQYAEKAPSRVTLAVVEVNDRKVMIEYKVLFPPYTGLIREWEKHPEAHNLPDNFPPSFALQFKLWPTTDGFRDSPLSSQIQDGTNVRLVFDVENIATGQVALAWTTHAPPLKELCVAALFMGSPGQKQIGAVYSLPVRITVAP